MTNTGKVRVEISRELIEEMVKNQNEDIPNDAQLLNLTYNPERDLYDAVFTSETAPEIHEAVKVPYAHELENNHE